MNSSSQHLFDVGLVWLRRDLRVHDNAALAAALRQCRLVHCVFVLDRNILDPLPKQDRRVAFILEALHELNEELRSHSQQIDSGLCVLRGAATVLVVQHAVSIGAEAVFHANDYEPEALLRDDSVRAGLAAQGIAMVGVKDHVVFEKAEILTRAGTPYTVFTPYLRAWLLALQAGTGVCDPVDTPLRHRMAPPPALPTPPIPSLGDIGFESPQPPSALRGGRNAALALLENFRARMAHYEEWRNYPALKGPSYLSVHLRFGTLSIREVVAMAHDRALAGCRGAQVWLSELAWRDFYFQILHHFPHVAHGPFRPAYAAIAWEEGAAADTLFAAWCEGQTGYPLVDAAMRQLNHSGYMHNRLRMVTGSFLVKHLGIDWRRGEEYFAKKLNDFDLAANNGGWQWVSSSGCDAQPYFRIFHPVKQSEKFDPEGRFILRYLPQLQALPVRYLHAPWLAGAATLEDAGVRLGQNYPHPVVDHTRARAKTLLRYSVVSSRTATNNNQP